MGNETIIEIKNLSLSYESDNTTYEALKDINLTIIGESLSVSWDLLAAEKALCFRFWKD